jgi:signal transduction histidine kinase
MEGAALSANASVPFALIRAATECRLMADFCEVLRVLMEIGNAQGCILWEIISFGPEERRFFALAEHFPGEPNRNYLPLKSVTGEAVADQRRQVVNNLEEAFAQGRVPNPDLLRRKGVRALCSVPISLGAKRESAVNLYRTISEPFSEEELDRIESAAAAIPHLFKSVRNEMGFRLVREVEGLLRDRSLDALQDVLERVTDAFNALESAVFLEDPLVAPEVYTRRATVWPWDWEQNQQYRKTDQAMTTWTIRNGRTLRLFDLSNFEIEVGVWGYEGVTCRNKEKLQESAKKYFKREMLPPLSFICAPVKHVGRAIGAIRCCVTRTGPHVFDDRHIEILEIVADQIGERWGAQLKLRRENQEKERFGSLSRGVDRLNAFAFNELRKGEGPSFERQIQSALVLLSEITGFGEALSVLLVDSERKDLYLAASLGERWKQGGARQEAERIAQRFPLSGDSACSRSISEKRVLLDERAGQPGRLRSALFPEATRVLHAPILVGGEPVGVLGVRGFGDRPFPEYVDLITGLIARQLGVYHHMFQQFKTLQQTTTTLRKNLDEQHQVFDDFHHQISSPIQKAHRFAQQAVLAGRPAMETLRAIRGNARRAEQVAQNIKYFIALVKGEFTKLELQVLVPERVVKRLNELAEDQESAADPTKKLLFRVDGASFEVLAFHNVQANAELLEHAVMNLLDNAAKYSFRQTVVLVRGGLDHTESRFQLSVINKGYPITPQDKKKLVQRGYRGDRARLTVVEGRGLGLYIVKQFMQAMGGDLVIIPTDSRGLNEFRLVLPCIRV